MSEDMTGYAGEIWCKKCLLEHESEIFDIGQARLEF
jgi:hypothetical protein